MKLSEIKSILSNLNRVEFRLENGLRVPEHFHVTEIGLLTKHYIDCGGTIRNDKVINFQIWNANDIDHRLEPMKLLKIIRLSEEKLGIEDANIEVEYQVETIGKYDLDFDGTKFVLKNKQAACLASDSCGVDSIKPKVQLSKSENACCTSKSGRC